MILRGSHAPYAVRPTQLLSSVTGTETTDLIADPVTGLRKQPMQEAGLKLRAYSEKRCAVNGSNIGVTNHPRGKTACVFVPLPPSFGEGEKLKGKHSTYGIL